MYINNSGYTENQECSNCKNNNICKWTLSKGEINTKVNEIRRNKEFGSPIQVVIQCSSFKRNSPQEGWRLSE